MFVMLCMSVIDPCPAQASPYYLLSSRQESLRIIHESTAKIPISVVLPKHLAIFLTKQTCRLRFFYVSPSDNKPFLEIILLL